MWTLVAAVGVGAVGTASPVSAQDGTAMAPDDTGTEAFESTATARATSTPRDIEAHEITTAELSAFLDASELEEATSEGPSLRVYGFADFSVLSRIRGESLYGVFEGSNTNFFVGNLNVYLDADLTHGVRSLSEIRFTYLPGGSAADVTAPAFFNNAALDYADDLRTMQWGGIEIERAWVEYAAHNLFVVRAGQYLTPYGIWNVDHGSPTIIPTTRPYVVGEALLPERQTGFQIYGSHTARRATVGYHLTLSNGRGTATQYKDFDDNKAVGGRLYVSLDSRLGALRLGLSGYAGRRTDADIIVDGTNLGNAYLVQWDEFSYAGDVLWKYKGIHFQFEAIGSDIRFTDRGRYSPVWGTPAHSRLADYRRWGLYGLLGYRTPWLGLMPYVLVSVYRPGAPAPVDVSPSFFDSVEYSIGLNMRPIAALALKLQYSVRINDQLLQYELLGFGKPLHNITGQVAWSF